MGSQRLAGRCCAIWRQEEDAAGGGDRFAQKYNRKSVRKHPQNGKMQPDPENLRNAPNPRQRIISIKTASWYSLRLQLPLGLLAIHGAFQPAPCMLLAEHHVALSPEISSFEKFFVRRSDARSEVPASSC